MKIMTNFSPFKIFPILLSLFFKIRCDTIFKVPFTFYPFQLFENYSLEISVIVFLYIFSWYNILYDRIAFFFFFIWQMKSHEIVQRPRADFVFPVIPHPLEGFCSRIFNLYHFPVQNVIWSNMQQEKIHSRYKYYSIPSLHFGLTIITIFFRFQLSSSIFLSFYQGWIEQIMKNDKI